MDVHLQNQCRKGGLKGGGRREDVCLQHKEVFFNGIEG